MMKIALIAAAVSLFANDNKQAARLPRRISLSAHVLQNS